MIDESRGRTGEPLRLWAAAHMMRRDLALVLAVVLCFGCGHSDSAAERPAGAAATTSGGDSGTFPADLAQLQREQEKEQQRLVALRASNEQLQKTQAEERLRLETLRAASDEAERKAQVAKEESEYQECKATVSELEAAAMFKLADCKKTDADYQSCRAARSTKAAWGTAAGCGVAMLLGVATMGASLAMCALGGGAGYSVGGPCGDPPTCPDDQALLAAEMSAHGIAELPMCGGSIGVVVGTVARQVEGWPVAEVEPGSAAAEIGIEPSDLIARVGNTTTDAEHPVSDALQTNDAGKPVPIEVVRNGVRYRFSAVLPATKLLGVKTLPSGTATESVVSVQKVPAAHALQVGDVVSGINGHHAPDIDKLRGIIRLMRSGEKVAVEIERGSIRQVIDVELRKRTSPVEL